jgi:hypothetical protein
MDSFLQLVRIVLFKLSESKRYLDVASENHSCPWILSATYLGDGNHVPRTGIEYVIAQPHHHSRLSDIVGMAI